MLKILLFTFIFLFSTTMPVPAENEIPPQMADFISSSEILLSQIDSLLSMKEPERDKIDALAKKLGDSRHSRRLSDNLNNNYQFSWKKEIDELLLSLEQSSNKPSEAVNQALISLKNRIEADINTAREIQIAAQAGSKMDDLNSLKELLHQSTYTGTPIQPGAEASNENANAKSEIENSISKKIENFFKGLDDWFKRNFGSLPGVRAGKKITNLNWLVVAFVIAVLTYFFASIVPFLRRSKSHSDLEIIQQETLLLSINDALQKSEAYARANDIRAALSELLRGFFKGLDELEKIPYRQSRTNREYQQIIRRKAAKHVDFAASFLPYMDDVLYAGHTAESEKYTEFLYSLKKNFSR